MKKLDWKAVRQFVSGFLKYRFLAVQRVHVVNATTLMVNLDAAPRLPFGVATVESHTTGGWVRVQRLNDGLYVDGRKVILHLSELPKIRKSLKGYELRYELMGKPVLNANILDALYENTHLIPEDWKRDEAGKVRFIYFWETTYRDSDADILCVRGLYFFSGMWKLDYGWFL
ncbi:MAG: hypothetical protein AAB461_00745 [Patescibacteria group bacterium]